MIDIFQYPQTADETIIEEICDNESIVFEGVEYEEAGVYPIVVQDVNGCDFVRTLDLTVLSLPDLLVTENICWNESVELYGEVYNASGVYFDTIPDVLGGCDTAVVIDIFQYPQTADETIIEEICDNESIVFEGVEYEEAGVYPIVVQDVNGCDFVLTLDLTVISNPTITNDLLICPGDTVIVGTSVYTEGGNFIDTLANPPMCDSIIFTNITVLSADFISIDTTICEGDTIFGFFETGQYQFEVNQGACFTIVDLSLTVEPHPIGSFQINLCLGSEVEFLGQIYDQPGIFEYSVSTDFLCDSIYIIEVLGISVDTMLLDVSICSNEDFMGYTDAGIYEFEQDEGGLCPVLYIVDLEVNDLIPLDILDTICPGNSVEYFGETYTEVGIYYDTLQSVISCDTAVIIEILHFEDAVDIVEEISICTGDTISFHGTIYYEAGTYVRSVVNADGCYFDATLILTIDDNIIESHFEEICWNESVVIRGVEYFSSVSLEELIPSITDACDTLLQIEVVQFEMTENEITEINICGNESFTFEGEVFTDAGTYDIPKIDNNGCAYTATLILGVDPNPIREETIILCEGESYTIGDSTYTESGMYESFIDNPTGCDSLILTDLNILINGIMEVDSTICSGEEVYGFTESGSYNFEISNDDCTVEVNLELTVLEIPVISFEEVICIGDSVEILGEYYYSDFYSEQFLAGEICDTLLIINVEQLGEIVEIDTVICAGETVFGIGESGDYEIEQDLDGGCFDLILISIEVELLAEVFIQDTICAGDSLLWNGMYVSTSGVYEFTSENAEGCDSIFVLELTNVEDVPSLIDTSICAGESFLGVSVTDTFTQISVFGSCEVEILVYLEVQDALSSQQAVGICEGDTLFVGDIPLTTTDIHDVILMGSTGCDSLVRTFLTVNKIDTLMESVEICSGDTYLGFDASGIYEFNQDNGGVCEDFVMLELTVIPAETSSDLLLLCPGDSVLINGVYETEAGIYTDSLTSISGCDSLVFIDLIDVEFDSIFIDTIICQGLDFEGFDSTGVYNYELVLADDCVVDVELSLTVLDAPMSYLDVQLCEGETYEIQGVVYSEDTIVNVHLNGVGQCDSVVVYDLQFLDMLIFEIDTVICLGDSLFNFYESGIYEFVDNSGNCEVLYLIELEVVDSVFVEQVNGVPSSCGQSDGSIVFEFSSEIYGAIYSIDGGLTYQDSSVFGGLSAGDYELLALFPGYSCLDSLSYDFEIGGSNMLVIDTLSFVNEICNGELGEIEFSILNGEGPYEWIWNDGFSDSVRIGLEEGIYEISVIDVQGCSAEIVFEVIQGEELASDYSGSSSFSICYGDTILLSDDNVDLMHEWFVDGELVGTEQEIEVTEVGLYTLISSDGESCDAIVDIEVIQSGVGFEGVDFLIPREGVKGTPIASVDVSFPGVDAKYYEYDENLVQIIQELENRTVFLFEEEGVYEISFIATIGDCAKKITKEISIVNSVEELQYPELYQAFTGSIIDFGLYPNPNDGVFKAVISMSGIQAIEVIIFDVNGNIILSESHSDEVIYELDYSLPELPAGPYSYFVSAGIDWKYIGFIKD